MLEEEISSNRDFFRPVKIKVETNYAPCCELNNKSTGNTSCHLCRCKRSFGSSMVRVFPRYLCNKTDKRTAIVWRSGEHCWNRRNGCKETQIQPWPSYQRRLGKYLFHKYTSQVLGIFDRSLQKGHFQRVRNRQAPTIIPIIQQYVLPGSTVHTDDWRAYRCLDRLGYAHEVVIHKRHFVDPTTGVHTNNIEAMWSRLKEFLRPYHGSSQKQTTMEPYGWIHVPHAIWF